jgi:hypothetical protein
MGKQSASPFARAICRWPVSRLLGFNHCLRTLDRLHHAAKLTLAGLGFGFFAAAIGMSLSAPRAFSSQSVSVQAPPFKAHVDMQTFMEHVLTPAAKIIWRVNGTIIDKDGEHDLSPRTDADWEELVSGAATLAEATNALMIPERARDGEWNFYAAKLAAAASKAYRAAEEHDLTSISEVSDSLDGVCSACHKHYGLE